MLDLDSILVCANILNRRRTKQAFSPEAVSSLGGFLLSAVTDLPSGAVIVLASAAFVGLAALLRRFADAKSPPWPSDVA
jgi:hypothetical protein